VDTSQFEAVLKGAREVGALCVRAACLGGRRYETFSTLEAWRKFVAESRAAIQRAVPIAEKLGVKFTLENHKDWTAEEFVKLLKEYSSPNLGVCLDTGNNISLLDDPMELVEALAPYAFSTHLKDMAVAPYKEGFLLSEVPFGDGFLDMKRIIATIRAKQPGTRFTLEMITRNPLKVPVFTDKYWETFPDRSGRHLVRAVRMVEANKPRKPLPSMEGKDAAAQLAYENDNVKLCLAYAREHYGLA
jgi:sugar phosphate isomerase/epimerase